MLRGNRGDAMSKRQQSIRTSFLASFDSVRFARPDPEDTTASAHTQWARAETIRRAHANLELLLSLSFGRPMLVTENVAGDSIGFLETAPKVLAARELYLDGGLANSPILYPFKLSRRRSAGGTVAKIAAAQLQNQTFVSSAFTDLNKRGDDREKLGNMLGTENFTAAKTAFPLFELRIGQLERLHNHLLNTDVGVSQDNKTFLRQAVERLRDSKFEGHKFGNDLPLEEIREAIRAFNAAGCTFESRSAHRNLWPLDGVREPVYELLTDYIDAVYNRLLARVNGAFTQLHSNRGL